MSTFLRRSGGARLGLADFIVLDRPATVDGIAYDFFERAGQVLVFGIASGEAFGTASVLRTQQVLPGGIDSAGAVGQPDLQLSGSLYPDGLPSGEAFGSAALAQSFTASSIASSAAFGAAVLVYPQEISTAGIASALAFGSALLAEIRTVQAVGIASSEAVSAPVLLERQRIEPSGIASAEVFGSPLAGRVFVLNLAGIDSGEAFGIPSVLRSGLDLSIPDFAAWTVRVLLGGVDVSALLVGRVAVEAEEGAARLADLTLAVAAGEAIELVSYTGKAVTVDFGEAGSGVYVRMFTGVVELPRYDFASRTLQLHCTDDLPGVVAALSRPQIDALIGGEYAESVFAATADQWQYARDRASTVAGSLDLSPAGAPRFSWWLSSAEPADWTFTADRVLYDAAVEINLANRSEIKNRVVIDYSYRFPRCKRRSVPVAHTVGGYAGVVWADFLAAGRWTLSRAVVREALSGAGWSVVGGDAGITFDAVPATGVYQNALGEPFVWNNPAPATICVGFSAALTKSYAQIIEERYTLTVENAASVAALGALTDNVKTAMEVPFDVAAWEAAANAQPTGGGYAGDPAEPTLATISSGELAVDYFPAEETNRTAADAAMRTLVAQATTSIYAAHRLNSVSFSVPLVAALDTPHTVFVSTVDPELPPEAIAAVPHLKARGKVRRVTHQMDLGSGEAVSMVTLALCSLSGLGFDHPASAPEVPAPPAAAAIDAGAVLECTVTYPNLPEDDHALTITAPAIDAASRNHYSPTITAAYAARIVEDLFEITT